MNYTGTGDGVQADSYLYVDGGNFDFTTSGTYQAYSSSLISSGDYISDDFKYAKNSNGTYYKVDSEQRGRSGTYALQESVKGFKVGAIDQENSTTEIEINSQKYYVAITNATMNLNTDDDGIHVNLGYANISKSKITCTTLDQPISSDGPLTMTNLALTVPSCYEGLQGSSINIKGSNTDINITSSDDGMNATSDYVSSDQDFYAEILTIDEGKIRVNADGDGLDSNGSMVINGGDILIQASSSSGDSPLDSASSRENTRNNGIYINGGTLMASGTSGMLESPQTTSLQNTIVYAGTTLSAGSVISLKDSSGTVLVSNTITKSANAAVITSPYITTGSTYSVYVNDELKNSAAVSSIVTTIGSYSSGNTGGPGGGGGFNPGRP